MGKLCRNRLKSLIPYFSSNEIMVNWYIAWILFDPNTLRVHRKPIPHFFVIQFHLFSWCCTSDKHLHWNAKLFDFIKCWRRKAQSKFLFTLQQAMFLLREIKSIEVCSVNTSRNNCAKELKKNSTRLKHYTRDELGFYF